jgi:O-antigen/teichoic acid export membrane protein
VPRRAGHGNVSTQQTQAEDRSLSAEGANDVRTAAKGGAVQIGGQMTARGLLFIFVAIATRVLGVAGFGLYRQVFQILNVVGLLAPGGFNFSAVRFIARARVNGDHAGVRGAARVSIAGSAIFSTLLGIGIFFGANVIASWVADNAAKQVEIAGLLRLGAAYVPLYGVMQVFRACTQAYKTMVPSVMVGQVILPVGRLVLGIAALLAGLAVAGAVASLVASAALSLSAGVWYFRRMMTPEERAAAPRSEPGAIVRFAIPQAGVNLLGVQALGLGVVLLAVLSTDRAVGLFSVALSLQGIGGVFLTGVVAIFAPLVVDLYERQEIARLESLYQTINRWVATFSFPVFAALIFAPGVFVHLLAGGRGADAARLVTILAVGNLFFVGSGPCSYLISMTGRAGLNFVNSLVAVVAYVALGVLLVPRYGVIGMAVTDAAVTAGVNSVRLIQAKVLIGVQPFGRSFAKPVIATLGAVVVLVVGRALVADRLVYEIGVLALAAVVYLALLRALGIDPEERHVYDRIRSKALRRGR